MVSIWLNAHIHYNKFGERYVVKLGQPFNICIAQKSNDMPEEFRRNYEYKYGPSNKEIGPIERSIKVKNINQSELFQPRKDEERINALHLSSGSIR
jgi:hypothetical protein